MADMFDGMERSLEYLAGFFDGEGSVSILRNEAGTTKRQRYLTPHHFLQVTAVQIDPRPLWLLQAKFGGKTLYITRRQKGARPIYNWHISGDAAAECLKALLPYLVVKKVDAEIGIAFRKFAVRTKTHGVSPSDAVIAERETYRAKLIELHGTGSRAVKRRKEA